MYLYVTGSSLTRKEIHFQYGAFPQNRTVSGLDNGLHHCITMLRLLWFSQGFLQFKLTLLNQFCFKLGANDTASRKVEKHLQGQ